MGFPGTPPADQVSHGALTLTNGLAQYVRILVCRAVKGRGGLEAYLGALPTMASDFADKYTKANLSVDAAAYEASYFRSLVAKLDSVNSINKNGFTIGILVCF